MFGQERLFDAGQEQLTSDDYYTPKAIFDALGLRFDLDVCAPAGGVPWIPCERFYTMADDGLSSPWHSRVWMNPPYSNPGPWVHQFIEHAHGIALLPQAKSAWHITLWAKADAIAVPFAYFAFIGGWIPYPVCFAAFGEECVDALHRVGVVRCLSTILDRRG
jgi:DNA N-6-adenine-methyltransferase (Dam)